MERGLKFFLAWILDSDDVLTNVIRLSTTLATDELNCSNYRASHASLKSSSVLRADIVALLTKPFLT